MGDSDKVVTAARLIELLQEVPDDTIILIGTETGTRDYTEEEFALIEGAVIFDGS